MTQRIIDNDDALIVVDRNNLLGDLRNLMPPGTRMQSLGDRGPAEFVDLSKPGASVAGIRFRQPPIRSGVRELEALLGALPAIGQFMMAVE